MQTSLLSASFIQLCRGGRGLEVRKRSWADITVDILEVALVPSNKMRIMYKSNLNFERFNKYFSDLLRKGLIVEMDNDGRRVYEATDRGKNLLEVLRKAQEIFSEEP
jgi:predicted transcriptional regulator